MCACACVCVCAWLCIYVHFVYIYTHTRAHIHTCTYTHTQTHTHTSRLPCKTANTVLAFFVRRDRRWSSPRMCLSSALPSLPPPLMFIPLLLPFRCRSNRTSTFYLAPDPPSCLFSFFFSPFRFVSAGSLRRHLLFFRIDFILFWLQRWRGQPGSNW